jgi:hypothetical protein
MTWELGPPTQWLNSPPPPPRETNKQLAELVKRGEVQLRELEDLTASRVKHLLDEAAEGNR